MAETIKSQVDEMMASEAIHERIQRRLKEERAALEDKVLLMLNTCCHCVVMSMAGGYWRLLSSVHQLKHSLEPSCLLHLIDHAPGKNTWTSTKPHNALHVSKACASLQTSLQLLIPLSCFADDKATGR